MTAKSVQVIEPSSPQQPTNALEMIRYAIEKGSGIDVIERLLCVQERIEKTNSKRSFETAMAAIREELPTIVKTNPVDFGSGANKTSYKFEDLASVTEAVAPVLARQGLSFRWRTDSKDGSVTVTCILTHRDGHSEETSLTAKPDATGAKNAIQAIGSAVTYLQRYTLKAALGVAAANDTDGHVQKEPEIDRQDQASKLSAEQASEIASLLERTNTDPQKLCRWAGIKTVSDLPADWFVRAKKILTDKLPSGAAA